MSGIIGGAGSRSGLIGTTELRYEVGTYGGSASNVTLFDAGAGSDIRCATYGTLAYTVTGNMCNVRGELHISTADSAGGSTKLKLPFVCAAGTERTARSGTGIVTSSVNFDADGAPGIFTVENVDYAYLVASKDNIDYQIMFFAVGDVFMFNFIYEI